MSSGSQEVHHLILIHISSTLTAREQRTSSSHIRMHRTIELIMNAARSS